MFRRVLFPTDLSAYAQAVLNCLLEFRSVGVREVILLSVIRSSDVPLADTPVNADCLSRIRWGLEQQLSVAQQALQGQGMVARTRVEYGVPAREIVRVAQEESADLIVMGAQGQGLLQEFLLGSTAYDVLRLSPIPVLVEKFEVVRELEQILCRRRCRNTFTRVLHPTDFSECANHAFALVKRLKVSGTETVILLHVQDARMMRHRSSEQLAAFDREDMDRLERMKRDLALYGLEGKVLLAHGLPHRETLRIAEEEDVGLIVVGLYGRSALQELLGGGTFEAIVRTSRRPVLVVPGGERR